MVMVMKVMALEVIIGDGSEKKYQQRQYTCYGNDNQIDDNVDDDRDDFNDDDDTNLQVPQYLNVSNRTADRCAPEHHLGFVVIIHCNKNCPGRRQL